MHEVRCTGCRARIGFANNKTVGRIWCSQACTYLPGATSREARDDLLYLLYRLGRGPSQLAEKFNLHISRIFQIIDHRSTP